MNAYLYFYKPCYDTTGNCTGLFGFMGDDENVLSGTILADDEHQAEARAREKEYKLLKKHFDYVTGVEILKTVYIGKYEKC